MNSSFFNSIQLQFTQILSPISFLLCRWPAVFPCGDQLDAGVEVHGLRVVVVVVVAAHRSNESFVARSLVCDVDVRPDLGPPGAPHDAAGLPCAPRHVSVLVQPRRGTARVSAPRCPVLVLHAEVGVLVHS